MDEVTFVGRGLHGGERCEVVLTRNRGPVVFGSTRGNATIAELEVVRADRGVRVRAPSIELEVELVEHLLAALAGLHVRSGIRIEVKGGEVPLLDGGARELALGLRALGPDRAEPPLRITRSETIEIGASRYSFEPADRVELEVTVDFASVGRQSARHDGDPTLFLQHIAPARTFGFEREADELERSGRARWVDPHAVLVLDDEGRARPPAAPPGRDELARHKLLDLMGDLYLFGGPPIGRIIAERPGHEASHRAAAQALDSGLFAPIRGGKTAGN